VNNQGQPIVVLFHLTPTTLPSLTHGSRSILALFHNTMSYDDEDEDDVAEVDAEEIDDEDDDNNNKHVGGEAHAVAVVDDAVGEDEDDEALEASIHYDDDDDEEDEAMTIKSGMSGDSIITGDATKPVGKKRKKPCPPPGRKARQPAVLGLSIPFRATKRAMKLDPDIGTVQNEAAILTTLAAELFVKKLANESHVIAKARGRNTIRYEDLAEARTKDSALGFLTTILP
jgi:histone H3/H4